MRNCWTLTFLLLVLLVNSLSAANVAQKPTPSQCVELLKEGNRRFVSGDSIHPHSDNKRLIQAGKENQGNHAYATVITCSDSRVPVERLFDAGVMDIFVIRVAGNVCDTDEIGSIEYGLCHVNTPVLVVLGHTQCGAVTAVTKALEGHGHALERNIPPLVDNIQPAVERAMASNPHLHGIDIVCHGIEENVWQSIEDLFIQSPACRNLVHQGKAKVVGAIYDVATGKVKWLPEGKTNTILSKVEKNPHRAMEAMASHSEEGHAEHDGHEAEKESIEKVELMSKEKLFELDKKRRAKLQLDDINLSEKSASNSGLTILVGGLLFLGIFGGAVLYKSNSNNVSLGGKLYNGFAVIIILTLAVGYGGHYYIGLLSENMHKEAASLELEVMCGELMASQNEFVLYGIGDKKRGQELQKHIKETIDKFNGDCKHLAEMHLDNEELAALKKLEGYSQKFRSSFSNLSKKYHEVEEQKEKLDELGNKMNEQLAEVIHEHEKELKKLESSRRTNRQQLQLQTRLVEELFEAEVACAKLLKEELEFLLTKHVSTVPYIEKGIGKTRHYVEKAAKIIPRLNTSKEEQKHDLEELLKVNEELKEYQLAVAKVVVNELDIEHDLRDCTKDARNIEAIAKVFVKRMDNAATEAKEHADLASLILIAIAGIFGTLVAFTLVRQITGSINTAVETLASGAEQVKEASKIVSTSSQEMAMGTSEQASSLEEISASLEEMTSMTKQNSDNAQQARGVSEDTLKSTKRGREVMVRMSSAINAIKSSSDETAKIVKTIDEIAFQTNLLALNAAVEAARAGEAGKGFAVVAEEVRSLAQRSAEAAKNTSELIDQSQKNADSGVGVATEVQSLLENIGEGIEKLSVVVSEVATSSQEQSQGITQINSAIAQLDTATQSNASSAEEAASTSEELSSQAISLSQVVSGLKGLVDGTSSSEITTERKTKPQAPTKAKISHELQHGSPLKTQPLKQEEMAFARKPALPTTAIIPLDESELADF